MTERRLVGSIGFSTLEALNNLCFFLALHRLRPKTETFRCVALKRPTILDAQGNVLDFGEDWPQLDGYRMEVEVE